jgi:hypothetical protein
VESWQVLVGVAAFALAIFTFLMKTRGAIGRHAATARIVGYVATGIAALVGVPALLAIIPAVAGMALSYFFLVRDHRT